MSDIVWKDSLAKSGIDKIYFDLLEEQFVDSKTHHVVKLSSQTSLELPNVGYDTLNMPGIYENDVGRPVTEALTLIDNSNCLRKMTNTKEVTAGRSTTGNILVGVSLCEELYAEKITNDTKKWCLILGTIVLENLTLDVEELRRYMCSQLPIVPASFSFLTKEGWPVLRQQERLIKATHLISNKNVISIRKQFEKRRVGVITSSGESLGFIFIDLSYSLNQVREALNSQLRDGANVIKFDYKFVERNGWPIFLSQESFLTLMDILMDHSFCIQYDDKHERIRNTQSICHPTSVTPLHELEQCDQVLSQNDADGEMVRRRKKSWKIGSNQKAKDDRRGRAEKEFRCRSQVAKPILISYVRAEAAQYALQLKTELCNLGFSVYLDVHEIKTGSDWQDALNFAVRHCYIFVPLITPMYGKTQWTNREIKLADALGKLIIPVNFHDQWPPECLAIQFASTQYIPCRPPDPEHGKHEIEKPTDNRVWEIEYVKRVSREISVHFKRDQDKPILKKESFKPFTSLYLKSRSEFSQGVIEDVAEKQKLIVISVHPKQKAVARQLSAMFTKDGYQVWCSTDIPQSQSKVETESDSCFANALTPRELPTIPEGEVFFSQCGEMSVSFGDTKRYSSVFRHDNDTDHRPLSRLMSQVSDFGQVTSLTPEKIEDLRTFQQQTDQAGVVIVVVSEAYTKSKTSQKQVFYCEHRKQVVMVKYDDHQIPTWFTRLMGNDLITYTDNTQFEFAVRARVKRALNPASSETPKDATAEAKMQCLVNFMKKNLPVIDECVYIAGSSKLQNPISEEICKVIARELAKVKNITVVTGGFLGATDIVARTFFDIKQKNSSSFTPDIVDSSVVHILPVKDSQDFTSKAQQQPDGSFEAVPYGKTMFLGDSVKERESAVARLFDTCILIEGGPGTAREVEEFIWNDHFVIPIISTGGAAAGQYGVPVKIFEIPPCVSAADWSVLSEKEATPEEVAKAVVNIIVALKRSMASHSRGQTNASPARKKSKKKLKSRKGKDKESENEGRYFPQPTTSKNGMVQEWEANSEQFSRIVEPRRKTWWQKLLQTFSRNKYAK